MHARFYSLSLSVALALGSVLVLGAPLTAKASYLPGETLDPSCLPTDSTCVITSLTASSTVNSIPYYAANGSVLSATSTLTILTNNNVGIGTTTPGSLLSVSGIANFTTATSTFYGNGINLTNGCFSVNNTCIGGVSGGAANKVAFWTGASTLSNNTNFHWDNTNARLGIGTTSPFAKLSVVGTTELDGVTTITTSGTGSGALILNANTGAAPSVPHSGSIHVVGADNDFAGLYVDTFGSFGSSGGESSRSLINLRSARGTLASPLPGVASDEIGRIAGRGYTGGSFTGSLSALSFMLAEDTTASAQGSYAIIRTTAIGTVGGGSITVPPETIRFQPSGGMSVGDSTFNATDPGHGYLTLSGNLGVGTTSPYAKLSVEGSSALGNSATAGYFTATSTTATSTFYGNVSIGGSSSSLSKLQLMNTYTGTATRGLTSSVNGDGSTVPTNSYGVYVSTDGTNAYGVYSTLNTTGLSTNAYGFYASAVVNGIGLTNAYGLYVDPFSSATKAYGVYISGQGSGTNKFALYAAGTTDKSYFGGNVGIGTTSPYAKLSVVGETVSSYFTATSTTATSTFATGGLTVGTNQFVVQQNSGYVGIGTTSPYAQLTVWGTDTASTSPFTVANSASTTVFAVYNNGNATYSGLIFQSSDQRLKTNVTPLDASSSLTAILGLNPVSYTRLDQPGLGTSLGFIAQDVQQVFPELVTITSPTNLTPDGTFTLNYVGLIAPIVEAIKALAGEVGNLAESITTRVITAATGYFEIGHFSNQLCIGSTCVTESELKTLLNQSGGNGNVSSDAATAVVATPIFITDATNISTSSPQIVASTTTSTDSSASSNGTATSSETSSSLADIAPDATSTVPGDAPADVSS